VSPLRIRTPIVVWELAAVDQQEALKQIDEYFVGKPESHAIFKSIQDRIAALGPSEVTVASQISFGANRKFAWFWLYNVTKRNPNGVPHLMLAIDNKIVDSHVRDFSQVGANRWNHQVVVRSMEDAKSEWLGDLLKHAYDYGSRAG